MLHSMTGYGTSIFENEEVNIIVEVKSLNSKFLDASIRLPKIFSDKEQEIRNILGKTLERGKVNVSIEVNFLGKKQQKASINKVLAKEYFEELKNLAGELGANDADLFRQVINMPSVIDQAAGAEDYAEEWKFASKTLQKAIEKCTEFRTTEGKALEEKLLSYISNIGQHLENIISYDPERIIAVKERIQGHLTEYMRAEDVDKTRFEQEMIYYIEKFDISEEKVRLNQHLKYYKEMVATGKNIGKKLGFISQEIGREINTIGSKANHPGIQKEVVNMKDELEKIKEQTLNIL